jgi:hypothetical protein
MAKKTIRDAVRNHFPKKQAELIIRAFNATKVVDIYDGDLSLYLEVIAQTLEQDYEKMYNMRSASITIKSIIEANF